MNIKIKSASDLLLNFRLSIFFNYFLVEFTVIISCEILFPQFDQVVYSLVICWMQLGCTTLVDRCTGTGCGNSCGVLGASGGGLFLFLGFIVITRVLLANFWTFLTLMYIDVATQNMNVAEKLDDRRQTRVLILMSLHCS